MRTRCLRFAVSTPFLLLMIGLAAVIAHAQAHIDPALPPAPLPRGDYWSLFPSYEVANNGNQPVPRLTVRQKFEIAYRKTFTPVLPIDSLVISGFDQATNLGPAYGQEWGAFGKRIGYTAANFTTTRLFASGIVPAAVHQDPRYFRLGSASMRARMGWVLRSQVVAFSDRGAAMPNYGKLIGYAASTAFSNVYMPAQNVTLGNNLKGYGIKFGASVAIGTIHEFDLTHFVRKRLARSEP
jgi:hypothetical protein